MIRRRGVRLFMFALAFLLAPGAGAQEKRVALLIGNQAYDRAVGPLQNPINDIALVGDALAKQNFELLAPVKDARRTEILGAVRSFVARLNAVGPNAIGFIYYSGHGAAEKDSNVNYLIPVDAQKPGTSEFWDESLKLDDIIQLLERAPTASKFIVFDACRSELLLPTKETTKGLLAVSEQRGLFVAFSTAPGRTASDIGGAGGPYATALARELAKPGLDHLNLFQNVKEAVLAATGGMQQPWESNGLTRRVFLTGEPPSLAVMVEQNFWAIVKDSDNPAVLQTYLDRYPQGTNAEIARALVAQRERELRARQAESEAQERKLEEERQHAEAKRLEDAQKIAAAELERLRRTEAQHREQQLELAEQVKRLTKETLEAKAAAAAAEDRSKSALRNSQDAREAVEAANKAQTIVAAAELQRAMAIKDAEDAKQALEAVKAATAAAERAREEQAAPDAAEQIKRAQAAEAAAFKAVETAEAQKLAALREADDAKAALAKLRNAQVVKPEQFAALAPPTERGAEQPIRSSTNYANLSTDDLIKEIQRELRRVGCDPGDLDGKWGENARAALDRFIKYAKVSLVSSLPSAEALAIISAQRVRICPLECGSGFKEQGGKCMAAPKSDPVETESRHVAIILPGAPPGTTCGAATCTAAYNSCLRKALANGRKGRGCQSNYSYCLQTGAWNGSECKHTGLIKQ